MMELKFKAGYLVVVKSWENDGDYNMTKEMYVSNVPQAKYNKKICDMLFKSHHDYELGISNNGGTKVDYKSKMMRFYEQNPTDIVPKEDFVNYVNDLKSELLGYSEFYDYKVCESYIIYKIPKDIYFKVIQ